MSGSLSDSPMNPTTASLISSNAFTQLALSSAEYPCGGEATDASVRRAHLYDRVCSATYLSVCTELDRIQSPPASDEVLEHRLSLWQRRDHLELVDVVPKCIAADCDQRQLSLEPQTKHDTYDIVFGSSESLAMRIRSASEGGVRSGLVAPGSVESEVSSTWPSSRQTSRTMCKLTF